jgi:hypothetical protein
MSGTGRDRGRIPAVAERPDPPFEELLRACASSAVHQEMYDSCTPGDPWCRAWLEGDEDELRRRLARPWLDWVAEAAGLGAQVRPARVVSEPVTDYIRFEHAATAASIAAGEQVRWLPRHLATGLLLPAKDFWVFDGRRAQLSYFSGPGEFLSARLSPAPAIAAQCAAAFEAVWERAVPHQEHELA